MAYCDFVVKYDPSKDTSIDIANRILYTMFIKRIKGKKPAVAGVFGASGEGKSYTACVLQERLLALQGIDALEYFNDINVYTPLQYPEKMDALLHDKRLKKINILAMHEARTVIPAKLWNSFVTQAVADVNAMSRTIKRLITLIVSQNIRDITIEMRRTLTYYIKISRPLGKRARMYVNILWIDERDLEKPKLRRRKLSGFLVYPNGRYRRYVPQYLEVPKPRKEIIEIFEKADFDSKSSILKRKLTKLMDAMKKEAGEEDKKIQLMVDWYIKNTDNLHTIGKRYRGRWKVKPDIREMHNLTLEEGREFEEKLNIRLKKEGIINDKGELNDG